VGDTRGVRVLYPIKGVGSLQLTDEALLVDKYGVTGAQYGTLDNIQAAALAPDATLSPHEPLDPNTQAGK
jgi:hypothetical protein